MRKQLQEMVIPEVDRVKEKAGQYHKDRDSEPEAPARERGGKLIAVNLSHEPNNDNQSQKTHRTRRSQTILEMMSHIVVILPWFSW